MDKAEAIEPLISARRVLGVDIGGSKTKAVVVDAGWVVERRQAPPGNALLDPELSQQLLSLIDEVRPDRVGIGLPGSSNDAVAAVLGSALSARSGVPVKVATDVTVTWLGSFLGRPGIVVYAGTGSFAVGGHHISSLFRAGGHGFLLGDEGGAYWLGREGLKAALADRDGTGPPTALLGLIEQQTGSDLASLVQVVHRMASDRTILAGLCPLVLRAAGPPSTSVADKQTDRSADPEALRIVEAGAAALVSLVRVLQLRLGSLPVAHAGGVLEGVLGARLGQLVPLRAPAAEPAVGAALLAAGDNPQLVARDLQSATHSVGDR